MEKEKEEREKKNEKKRIEKNQLFRNDNRYPCGYLSFFGHRACRGNEKQGRTPMKGGEEIRKKERYLCIIIPSFSWLTKGSFVSLRSDIFFSRNRFSTLPLLVCPAGFCSSSAWCF
mmetsp:Transcript_25842/g.65367  ORF Transcript_25842/g.65367 Transcript_25842/m.65367 type:complete len:116 (-) Transcript_25842:1374-1721(-)